MPVVRVRIVAVGVYTPQYMGCATHMEIGNQLCT